MSTATPATSGGAGSSNGRDHAEPYEPPLTAATRRSMLREVLFHAEAASKQQWERAPIEPGDNSSSYAAMMLDPTVAYAVGLLTDAILSAEWHVEPGEGDPRGRAGLAVAADLEANLQDIDMETALRDALDALWRGFRVQEISWRFGQRRHWLDDLAALDPDQVALQLDDRMRVVGVLSQPVGAEAQRVDRGKVWFHRNRSSRTLPAGESVLEPAYRAWSSKNRLLQFWGTSIQRFGMTHLMVQMPANTPPAEQTTLLSTLYQGRLDGVYLVKDTYTITPLNPTQWANLTFEKALDYQDTEMIKAILFVHTPGNTSQGQTYVSGAGLSEQARATAYRLQAFSRALARSFNADVIEPLCRSNWGVAGGLCPRLVIGKPDAGRIAALGDVLTNLVLGGVVDPEVAADQLGLPAPAPTPLSCLFLFAVSALSHLLASHSRMLREST